MTSLRHSPFCLATLAVYLAVNIGVGAFHHHAPASRSERTGDHNSSHRQAINSADHEGDEDSCLLCRVLHLARVLPIVVQVEAVSGCAVQVIPAVAITRPHFLETATHSRAPPNQ